ncbi:MAG TPA: hypothetical protein VGF29_14745 [Hyphomicrobiaceae bacterium]
MRVLAALLDASIENAEVPDEGDDLSDALQVVHFPLVTVGAWRFGPTVFMPGQSS